MIDTMTDNSRHWTRALCWATVTLEGFDIVALSAALPNILDSHHAGIGKAEATLVTTTLLVGILVGAVLVGPVSDRWGRKSSMMGSIALFSVLTLVVPLAPDVTTFAALRLLTGIGLGACMPAALTAMSETMPSDRRARDTTLTMTGYHVGAVLTSLVALAVVPRWPLLFVVGGVVGVVVLPVMWFKMPETNRRALVAEPDRAPRVPVSAVLRPPFLLASVATWVASFMGLLLVYGLNSWLPIIMRQAGYQLSASLTLLLLLNVGGVIGLVLAGVVGDLRGIRASAVFWFLAGAVFLGLLSVRMPTLVLDTAVLMTGVFVFSAQVLVYAWITRSYPAEIRGTALSRHRQHRADGEQRDQREEGEAPRIGDAGDHQRARDGGADDGADPAEPGGQPERLEDDERRREAGRTATARSGALSG
jgi:MFS family permease